MRDTRRGSERGAPMRGHPLDLQESREPQTWAQFTQRPLGEGEGGLRDGLTMILWVVVTRERKGQVGGLC